MSRCVPSWDVEDNTRSLKPSLRPPPPNSMSSNLHVPTRLDLDYEVAELTWKNGQLGMHGLGPPRVVYKAHSNAAWNKPCAAETLETIVNQATHRKPHIDLYAKELVPWLDHHSSAVAAGSVSASAMMTMDALVPGSDTQPHELLSKSNGGQAACSTRVGSCSSDRSGVGDHMVARGATTNDWSSCREPSASGSETFGMESSRELSVEMRKRELGVKGFTSPSMGSPEDTISGKRSMKSTSLDEHDSVCHSKPQSELEEKKKGKGKGKSSITTKRSRAAAIHNLSERKRRDKINQKMKTLQKLVPNANKTDKASMLDEVIEYLKQLQAQVNMIGRMSMSPLMMPLAMQQQQLQMAMGMGMGMGMGVMDLNSIVGSSRPNIPGMPPVFHPSTFMQPMMASWDMHAATGDRVPNHNNDPMAAFLACQSQPMTMEGYTRMASLFQQMQNQPNCYSGLKN